MANRYSVGVTIASTSSDVTYLPTDSATGGASLNGRLAQILYHAGTTPFTSNADVTITIDATSQIVLQTVNLSTGSQSFCPRQLIGTTTGGTTAAGGDYFFLANDRLKITVTDATVGNTGTFSAVII